MTSGAYSGSQIMRGLGGIIMGRLNDRIGPRIVLTTCALLAGLGFLLMYFVHSLWQFYVFYTLMIGIGLSGFWVPLLSTVARWFHEKRAAMSGLVLTSVGLATLVGAPLATIFLSVFDWRVSFLIMGSSILLIIPISAQFLRREPAEMGQLPDGNKMELEQKKTVTTGLSLAEALRRSHFWLFCFATMSFGYCSNTIVVHIVPSALLLNISPIGAAGILATVGAISLVGRLILGHAADKMGDRQVYMLGFIITSLSLLWLIVSKQSWMLYLFAVVFGLAQGGMSAVGSPLLAEIFGLRSHGSIFGVANFLYTIGAALGPVASGFLFDVTGNYQEAFIACTAISFLGIVLSVLLRRPMAEPG